MKLNEVKQKIDNFFNNLTEDEIEKLKEKYSPKESNTAKGWVSIEESLPILRALDLFEGGTEYKILFEDGQDFFKYEPENYDMIITNPPYSLKNKFLKRAYDLKNHLCFYFL